MPDKYPPSEFGGKVQKNRVQPPVRPDGVVGHIRPTASEKLMLTYTTGFDDNLHDPDDGSAFTGLLPYDQALAQAPKPEKFSFDE